MDWKAGITRAVRTIDDITKKGQWNKLTNVGSGNCQAKRSSNTPTQGELTTEGLAALFEWCAYYGLDFNKVRNFLDIGSGPGKPSLAAHLFGVEQTTGLEINRLVLQIGLSNLMELVRRWERGQAPDSLQAVKAIQRYGDLLDLHHFPKTTDVVYAFLTLDQTTFHHFKLLWNQAGNDGPTWLLFGNVKGAGDLSLKGFNVKKVATKTGLKLSGPKEKGYHSFTLYKRVAVESQDPRFLDRPCSRLARISKPSTILRFVQQEKEENEKEMEQDKKRRHCVSIRRIGSDDEEYISQCLYLA